jgi:phosphoribosyl 1,2-cyclic phosphodiesterase
MDTHAPNEHNLTLCILASGSKGNAIYVSDGDTSLLIDAGLSGKEIERRMRSRDLDPTSLDAILVTHEHADHVRGVGVLSRRYDLPVYINPKTDGAAAGQIKKIRDVRHFACGRSFTINDLTLHPFSTSHDASDSAGFTVQRDGIKIGIATDLGIATSVVRTHLKHCSLLILESNHDPQMLMEGPYPWYLKQRVRGRTGHLANEASRDLLGDLLHDRLIHVVLAHLSEQNNTPELALRAMTPVLAHTRVRLSVADQHLCSEVFRL